MQLTQSIGSVSQSCPWPAGIPFLFFEERVEVGPCVRHSTQQPMPQAGLMQEECNHKAMASVAGHCWPDGLLMLTLPRSGRAHRKCLQKQGQSNTRSCALLCFPCRHPNPHTALLPAPTASFPSCTQFLPTVM